MNLSEKIAANQKLLDSGTLSIEAENALVKIGSKAT
jgi:hypothetical protein